VFVSDATILHADLDAFFASVEQRDDPALRDRPIAVGSWVVTAASYEARARGVSSGMGGSQALRLCPDLRLVRPRWEAYIEASRAVFQVFRRTSPVVEGLSIDEAFLDVRGMARSAGTPTEIALRLRWEVRDKVGLPITVGVATTKHLAKVCSALAKPDGLMVVPPGCELPLLHRLPVQRLWGVGPATTARLHAAGITHVGQVAALDQAALAAIAGPAAGRRLHDLANNRDHRPVRAGNRRRTFGAQSVLGRGPRSPEALDSVLVGLVDRVTRRMRAKGRQGRTVVLRLRFGDYAAATRSRTMRRSTSASSPVLAVARTLLEEARPAVRERGLTLLGITVANLDGDGDPHQLTLPVDDAAEARSVDAALDVVRERFGPAAVTRASLLGRDPGLAQYLVPSGRVRPPTRSPG